MSTERKLPRYTAPLRRKIADNAVSAVRGKGLFIDGNPVKPSVVRYYVEDELSKYSNTRSLIEAWPEIEERELAYEFNMRDLEAIVISGRALEERRRRRATMSNAAPELLEVLQETINEVGHWLSTQKPELKEKIDSAINKALGE